MRKKLLGPFLILLVLATLVSAIVQADGNPTFLLSFLVIGLLYIAAHIPTKNNK